MPKALCSFHAASPGGHDMRFVAAGEELEADDPVITGRENLFAFEEVEPRRRRRKAADDA